MFIKRTLGDYVARLSHQFPAVLVTGPRQSGKTTLLKHIGQNRNYVSLDLLEERRLANENPQLFLARFKPPLTIDEIQYAPNLLSYIKAAIDRDRKPGLFWLTGSQHLHLLESMKETLAGRVAILNLLGFSNAEELELNAPDDPWLPSTVGAMGNASADAVEIFRRIVRGSLPPLSAGEIRDTDNFYGSYITTYIERDVRSIVSVGDQLKFEAFMTLLAARSGQLLNLNEVARETGVSQPTAERWLSVLIASFQVYLLRPFYKNITKRMIKTPKIYFLDTGVLCYLTKWKSAESALSGAMAGHLFETYTVNEILRSYWHRGRQAPIWYFRTYEKAEIDLLFEEEGRIHAAEIKINPPVRASEIRGLPAISRLGLKTGHNAVITCTQGIHHLADDVSIVPVTGIM
jgi:predicted AAA+ superfamily ATPase